MAISITSMTRKPHRVPDFSGFDAPKNGSHTIFDWTQVRVALNPSMLGGVCFLKPQKDAAGDTIYLSYFTNEISSVRLPPRGTAGIEMFLTDNLSGCKIFIDRIQGGAYDGHLVVYHANSRQYGPGGHLSDVDRTASAFAPGFEPAAAATALDGLHTQAMAHYQAAPHNLNLVAAKSLNKPVYNRSAEHKVQRKAVQGRLKIAYYGGTTVIGFLNATGWEFYYHTFGGVEYDRPAGAKPAFAKLRGKSGTHQHAKIEVLEMVKFYG